jgi:putative glutamine amidotransferase
MVIGITDCSKFVNYEKWLLAEPGVQVIRLSLTEGNYGDVERCDGIILSGGEDVHPRFYNKLEYLPYCHEIDEARDAFEWRVLEETKKSDLPLLGICRGLQMANVFFGGTLIPDLPAFAKFNHSRYPQEDRNHQVQVDPLSELAKIVGTQNGEVNSAHHQSAELIAKELVVNCLSSDGVVEGIEWKERANKPFLQLVQWHPERMQNLQSPFSQKVKIGFLSSVSSRTNQLKIVC